MAKKNPVGRPSTYTRKIADLICERTATSTFGLKKICSMYDDIPTHETVFQWRYKNKEFADLYTKAKIAQAELLAEEIIDIADDGKNDWMQTLDEEEQVAWKLNGEHVNRSRLRIDTRKWHASKLLPKIYGIPKEDDAEKSKSELELFALRKV